MKQIDNHRSIGVEDYIGWGHVVTLYYRVPYRGFLGRMRVKYVSVASLPMSSCNTLEEAVDQLQEMATARVLSRSIERMKLRLFGRFSK